MLTNPILKNIKNIFFYVIFWLFISLAYFLLISLGFKIDTKLALLDSLVFNFILAGLGLSIWYPAQYIFTENNFNYKNFFTHLIGAIISCFLWLQVGYLIIFFLNKS